MRVYSYEFDGRWPVGAVAVVVARDPRMAEALLMRKLKSIGLHQEFDPEMLKEIDAEIPDVHILLDGEY